MERVLAPAVSARMMPQPRRVLRTTLLRLGLAALMFVAGPAIDAAAQSPPVLRPIPDPNVNMVRGVGDFRNGKFDGDPYLQRQNEGSIAVSTRNPCHLLAGANDYRTVDLPDPTLLPNTEPQAQADAWLGVFKSYDCGQKWQSTLLPGYPQDTSDEGLVLTGFQAGADPTVRAGANGLFFYSGMVFNRGENQPSRLFVARFQDFNNKERGDTIHLLGITAVADGTSGQFVDKPWLAVDVPRTGFGSEAGYWTESAEDQHTKPNSASDSGDGGYCEIPGDPQQGVPSQRFPAGHVYLAWARFEGGSGQYPSKIMFARSTDCGLSFNLRPISDNQQISQGAMIAIAPDDGTVYVAWREFGRSGLPPSIHIMRSRDGGKTWSKPQPVVESFTPFDQAKTATTFRTNALPTIAAAPGGLVYVAFAGRGYAVTPGADGQPQPTSDARIVVAVSIDYGQTFAPPYPIDNDPARRGHQVMPALAYAAGKLHLAFYDFRDDLTQQFVWNVDERDNPVDAQGHRLRHTVDVRGAWADATEHPEFRSQLAASDAPTERLSRYAMSATLRQVQWNLVNLPLYGLGRVPFISDYIDTQGLTAVPVRSADGQQQDWRPNIGPIDFAGLNAIDAQAFASLPVFHTTWTDHRDVKAPPGFTAWDQYTAPGLATCDPNLASIRNANIYTARTTPGLYVGSPGNTKPLGKKPGTEELLQRGFAVFVQNTTLEKKRYRLTIVNQPAGGVASFRQFDRPAPGCQDAGCQPVPLTAIEVVIPRRSTIARTVYATSTDPSAQILVNVREVELLGTTVTRSDGTKTTVHNEKPDGLRASVLLNPDKTNPPILNPDLFFDPDDPTLIPQIAEEESHDAAISAPYYVNVTGAKSSSRALAVPENPDPENPDPENPDPENPDPENPDPENPDPENPDPENPDPENPDPENPDVENPDPENPDPENATPEATITAIRDVHWTVKNRGNTISAYHFTPTLKFIPPGLHFQLIVTRRYLVPVLNPATCKAMYRTESQVVVNVTSYTPRTPDPENPDPENPDPENPDPENPDPENPDPENPDPENVTFLLAPDESATVTLRLIKTRPIITPDPPADSAGPAASGPSEDGMDAARLAAVQAPPPDEEIDFSPRAQTAAVVTPQAADTGETEPDSAAAGPDLIVSEPAPTSNVLAVAPAGQVTLSFTITNRGTSIATAFANGSQTTIKTRFYLSTDNALSTDDVPLVEPGFGEPPSSFFNALAGSIPVCTETDPTACVVTQTQTLAIPRDTLPGTYSLFVIVDDDNDADDGMEGAPVDNEVFEADDFNNSAFVGPLTVGFILSFVQQPTVTTQDFIIAPALQVAVVDGAGAPVTDLNEVPSMTLAMGNNPGSPAPGTLAGTTTQPNVGGVATFNDLRINNAGVGYTLVAGASQHPVTGSPLAFPTPSVVFNVEPDDPPAGIEDPDALTPAAYTINENQVLTIGAASGVLANDTDEIKTGPGQAPPGRMLTALLAAAPTRGAFILTNGDPSTLDAEGSFIYRPNLNANGADVFTYRPRDGRSNGNLTTATITVLPVNTPPQADDKTTSTNEDTAVGIVLTGTDIETAPANLAFTITLAPAHGTLSGAAPNLTYTPHANYNGPDSFTYTVTDRGDPDNCGPSGPTCAAALTSADATVSITVVAVNDAPSFVGGTNQATAEDSGAQTVALWATSISPGPADESGQQVEFIVATADQALFAVQPAISPIGTLTYTPTPNANGTANVTVRIHDNGGTANGGFDTSAPVAFTISVAEVNDAPTAGPDTKNAVEDTALPFPATDLTVNDSPGPNEAAQTLTVTTVIATADTHGTVSLNAGTVTYTPAANYNGPASFTYTVCDDGTTAGLPATLCATGVVSVTVAEVNDAPTAGADAKTTGEDTPASFAAATLLTNDSAGPANESTQTLTVTAVSGTADTHGTAALSAGTVTYTPAAHYNGPASFTYTVCDNGTTGGSAASLCVTGVVNVTVTEVNDAPTAGADAKSTAEDTPLSFGAADLTANDSPGPNEATQTLTVTAVSATADTKGAVSLAAGTITYTPEAHYNGPASFSYTVCDNGTTGGSAASLCAAGVVNVTVTEVNDAPTAAPDTKSTPEDAPLAFPAADLTANDSPGPANESAQTLTVTSVSVTADTHGTVTLAAGTITYTPAPNYGGPASFAYTVCDNGTTNGTPAPLCASSVVNVTVAGANDPPVANDDAVTTLEDTAAFVAVLANDTDAEGDTLTVTGALAAIGTVEVNENNTITYTPPVNFNGPASFTYTISDGSGGSATATVTVTVQPVNDDPDARDDAFTVAEDSSANTLNVLANDLIAPDSGETLTVAAVTQPANGTVAIAAGGTGVIYTPPANFSGATSFTYTISDGNGGSDTAAVSVTVTPVNDAPVGVDDAYIASDNDPVIAAAPGVLGNDSDPDGDVLTAVLVKDPSHGTVTLNPDGSFTYVPTPGYTGSDNFKYRASDGSLTSNLTTVNLTVTPNELPVAVADTATTPEDTAVPIGVLANDSDADGDTLTISAVSNPAHGTATITGNGTGVTYQPTANFSGPDTFTYTVVDGFGGSAIGTVTVTVAPVNDAPVAHDDAAATVSGSPRAIHVLANDVDVDYTGGAALVTSESFLAPGMPMNFGFPAETAIVQSTGLVYTSGSLGIAVLDPASNAATAAITFAASPSLQRVNQTTNLLYFRAGSNLAVVDGRPGSPTFNQILRVLLLGGGIQSLALDEARGLLYVTNQGSSPQAPFQSRVTVIDVNPASLTFHQVVGTFVMPPGANARGVAVNTATNTVFVAAFGGTPNPATGVYQVPGGTRDLALAVSFSTTTPTLIGGTSAVPTHDLVVNEADNLVYAVASVGRILVVEPAADSATVIAVPNFTTAFVPHKRIVFHRATRRVYVRSNETTAPGKVVVIDGSPVSGTYKQKLAEIVIGRDAGGSDLAIDEALHLVVATSPMDLRTYLIDGATYAVTSVFAPGGPTAVEIHPATHKAYVTAFMVLQRIDLGSKAPDATIGLGAEAGFSLVNPDTHRYYLPKNAATATVQILDASGARSQVGGLTGVGRWLFQGRIKTAQTDRIYVANASANTTGTARVPGSVAVIDAATDTAITTVEVGSQPFALGVDEVGNKVYVGSVGLATYPGGLHVIDGASLTATPIDTSAFPSGTQFLRDIVAVNDPALGINKVYVRVSSPSTPQNPTPTQLGIVDGATNVATPAAAALGATAVNIIRAHRTLTAPRVYVGNGPANQPNQILVVDAATGALVTTIAAGAPSTAVGTQSYLAVDETRDRLYVANFETDTLTVLDALNDYAVVAAIATGDGPTTVAVNESVNRIYVGNTNDKTLTFVDGATFKILGTLSLPFPPVFLAVDPGVGRILAAGAFASPGAMLISDVTGNAPPLAVNAVTQGAQGVVAISTDGSVTYTPAPSFSGVDTFTYTATDGIATSNAATVTVTVTPTLAITTSSLPLATVNVPYSQTLTATGGEGALLWSLASGQLPGGLTLQTRPDGTGLISGIPSASGTFTFTVSVRDSAVPQQFATQVLTLVVGPPVVATGSLPSGWVGQAYSQTLVAGGVVGTAVWSLASGALPAGLSLSSGGVISGTPTIAETQNFTVRVADDTGQSGTRNLSIFIDGPPEITTTSLADTMLSWGYNFNLQRRGGFGPFTWTLIAGSLPPGLTLNANGNISGTPTATGIYTFTVQVTDSRPPAPDSDTQELTLRVGAQEQQVGGDGVSMVDFGTAGYSRVAEIVTVGATGALMAVQPRALTCPAGTTVTAEIRRLTSTPPFVPDDSVVGLLASATVTTSGLMSIATPPFFPVGARFAIVFSAAGACRTRVHATSDSYAGGEPYVFTGTWQSPAEFLELALDTYVLPQGLVYTRGWRGRDTIATPLVDGRVLITSGDVTAEVYEPATGSFTPTANDLQSARNNRAAVLLRCPAGPPCDYDGKVLVAGGEWFDNVTNQWTVVNTAHLYDPATNAFTPLDDSLRVGRAQPTLTRLLDGRVLVAGGYDRDPAANNRSRSIRAAEIFDPATKTFTRIDDMIASRREHTATLISCGGCSADGKVLLVGGYSDGPWPVPTAELFEPSGSGGTFRATTGGTADGFLRSEHTATPIANGNVVIAGGIGFYPDLNFAIEIYDAATDSFAAAGSIAVPRRSHTAVSLADGRVLLAGGWERWPGPTRGLASLEIYDPVSQTPTASGNLNVTRADAPLVRLTCPAGSPGCAYDNDILIVGGGSSSWVVGRSAEVRDFEAAAATLAITTTTLPDGQTGQPYPGAMLAAAGGTPAAPPAPLYTFSLASGGLPPSVVLDPDGAIHSIDGTTLATAGAYQFVARVRDSVGAEAFQSLTIRVDVLSITTTTLPAGVIGLPYDAVLAASGTPPYTWSHDTSIGGPPGLTVLADGHVSGTPTQTGCWWLGVRVRDGSFQTATKPINLCINQPLDITSPAGLSDAFLKEWYDYRINTSGGSQQSWSLALQAGERFPRGLEVTSDGRIRGNALETGTFTFTVQVTDASSPPQTDSQAFTLRVGANDQQISGDGVSMVPFGTSGYERLAQVVTTGATGGLMAVRPRVLTCPAGVSVTAEIRRLTATPPFVPDDSLEGLLASKTVTMPADNRMSLATPIFFPVGARFAIVLSATGACQARVNASGDSYAGGEPYVFNGTSWQSPVDFLELGLDTYVIPQGLAYTNDWRGNAVVTPLLDGRVLLTSDSQTAEVYDRVTGLFTPVANSMQVPRNNHEAVLLTCSSGTGCGYHGKVLVAGGERYDSTTNRWVSLSSAELFDPATNQFTPLANPVAVGRSQFTMTRLPDGRVLLAGGQDRDPENGNWRTIRAAEIFDPAGPTFTPIGDMTGPRRQHTATLISCSGCPADGKVLIVGGYSDGFGPLSTAELFEPSGQGGTFRSTAGSTAYGLVRSEHTATPLDNGSIVVAGGIGFWPNLHADIEIYDPITDSFTTAGTIAVPRRSPAAVRLGDGRILFAGGWESWFGSSSGLASVEIYDPTSQVSVLTTNLNVTRGNPAAVRVGDDVLVAGGGGSSWVSGTSAEIVDVVASSSSLAIATVVLPAGQTGQPYPGATLTAVGGTSPYTFSLASGSLPPGVVLDADGQVRAQLDGQGQPVALSVPGAFQFVAKVTDATGANAFRNLTIVIDALTITTASLPSGIVNQRYELALTATGKSPLLWDLDPLFGWLPPEFTVTANGLLSGTPTQTGCWWFGARVRDGSFQTVTKVLNLCINEPLAITTTSLRDGITTEGYGGCLNSTGGSGGVTWSVAGGALPAGLTLRPWGCFEGQILDDGLFSFTAQATDLSSPQQVVTKALTLRAWAPDQSGPGGDQQNAITLGGQQRVAQIVRAGALGDLAGVRVPVSCGGATLTVDIQGVTETPPFTPDGDVLLSTTVTPTDSWAPIVFGATRFFAHDERFAIVLSSGGTCQVTNLWTNEGYSGGEAWIDTGGGWQPLGGLGYPDLNFLTLVEPVRDLDYTRFGQWGDTSVVLGNGRVLMVPGHAIELYNPATHTTAEGPALLEPRWNHSVTKLLDGRVAIIGGETRDPNNQTVLRGSAEIYDPATGQVTTAAGGLMFPRSQHTATLLADGRVLIAGGLGLPDPNPNGFRPPFIEAELFDPETGVSTVINMVDSRWGHKATALADGRVLITGGWSNSWPAVSAEIFDPGPNTFTATANDMVAHRANHTATLLADGKVLIAGGHAMTFSGVLSSAEVFDPATQTFTAVGSLTRARQTHAAVRLDDGTVLVAGGSDTCCGQPWNGLASLERYDPASGTFTPAGSMVVVRDSLTVVLLSDGRAAMVGGGGTSVLVNRSIEFYAPADTVAITTTTLPAALKDQAYTSPPLAATGGTSPYAFAIAGGSLPPGLDLVGNVIVGTPTAIGTYRFTVRVTDGSIPALSNYQPLTIRVSPLDITTNELPRAYTGKPYSAQLAATGVGAVTWSLEAGQGSLPDGLTLNASGEIAGVPNPTGYFTFLVRAQDAAGQVATKWLSIQVDPGLAITTTSLRDGIVTEWYGGCLGTSGGSGGMSWTVVGGALPPGVTLTSWGCFEGQVLDVGSFTFTAQAADLGSPQQVETRELTIRAWAPDQAGPGGDQNNTVTIGGASQQRVAQIVKAGALGDLAGVRVPVSCSAGSLTVEIQGVTPTPPYQPNGAVLLSATVTPTDPWMPITFGSTTFIAHDEPLAIVLSSAGTCAISNLHQTYTYERGEAWTAAGGAWQPLSDLGYQDLNFTTLIVPARDLAYTRFGQWGHTSVVLDDGRVVMVPGHAIELYNPATHTTAEGPALLEPRWEHSVTKLLDGRVVIIGGEARDPDTNETVLRGSVEIYDPATGQLTLAPGGLTFPRSQHTATLLADGRVLITCGLGLPDPNQNGFRPPFIEAELFDPDTGVSTVITMVDSRWGHKATALADGRVLITGGWTASWPAVAAEIFDPGLNTSTATAGEMVTSRANHTATLLADGKVLIAGGHAMSFSGVLSSAEVFDPATQTFTQVGSLTGARQGHAAVQLGDGTVLVAGGNDTCCGQPWNGLASLERYDPVSGTFTPAGSMVVERDNLTVVLLSDGRAAMVGGGGTSVLTARSLEFFAPSDTLAITTTTLPDTLTGQGYTSPPLAATGGTPPYFFSVASGNLPPGLNLVGDVVAGTPTVAGTYHFSVRVTDSSSPARSGYQPLVIRVAAPIAIQAAILPDAVAGRAYAYQLLATGGLGTRIWQLVGGGTLPPGMTIAPDGTVTGISASTGVFTFTVRVQTPSGADEEDFTLTVVSAAGDESEWTTTFPPGGSIVAGALDVDPTVGDGGVYVAPVWRGLYKSTNAGADWGSILDHLENLPFDRTGINDVAFAPTGVLYLVVHGSVFRSLDRGATWAWANAGISHYVRLILPVTSSELYAGTDGGGVYRSTNGGLSWTAVNTGLPAGSWVRALASVPGVPGALYVGTQSSGAFKTIDAGDTWTALAGAAMTRVDAIAVDAQVPSRVYAVGFEPGQGDFVFLSEDHGVTWVRLSQPAANWGRTGEFIAVDPQAAGTVYVLSGNQVLKSTDAGANWSSTPLPNLFGGASSIKIHPADPSWVFVGSDSGMYRSLDAGVTWNQANAGILAVNLPHAAAHSVHVDQGDASYVYAGTNGGGYRSTDRGQTWAVMGLPEGWARSILTHPAGAASGVVYALSGNLWRSNSNGAVGTWFQPDGGAFCCSWEGDLALHPTDPSTLYRAVAGAAGGLYTGVFKSTDGGATWTAAGMTGLAVHTLTIDPDDGDTLYAGVPAWSGPDSGIYKTTNGGTKWDKLGGGCRARSIPIRSSCIRRARSSCTWVRRPRMAVSTGVWTAARRGHGCSART